MMNPFFHILTLYEPYSDIAISWGVHATFQTHHSRYKANVLPDRHHLGQPRQQVAHSPVFRTWRHVFHRMVPAKLISQLTCWLIPLSKWVITPVIIGLTLLIPFITGVITHLLSGMSHQVDPLKKNGFSVGYSSVPHC